jgi:PhnB protein
MATVGTYLNFVRNTEEAFNFYKSVFGTEFEGEVMRMGTVPIMPDQPPVPDGDKDLIMHIVLPILGGHKLHGTDAPESMGFKLNFGDNMYILLEPDSLEESQRLFDALSTDGKIEMKLDKMFWGDYFASWADKFGTKWMINYHEEARG